jgi:hypothetical protein
VKLLSPSPAGSPKRSLKPPELRQSQTELFYRLRFDAQGAGQLSPDLFGA